MIVKNIGGFKMSFERKSAEWPTERINLNENVGNALGEAKDKAEYECMECGKKFKKSGNPKKEIRCPSCKSVDIEPA